MQVSAPGRLVVIAPNWLGDAVMALPLVADLRRAWPGTAITVAARGSVAELFRMVEGIEDVVSLQGGGGFAALTAWRQNARLLSAGGFDAALLLPNSFLAAWTAARARIAERWGYRTDGRGRLLTRALERPPGRPHQAAYYQALGAGLGCASGPPFARVSISAGSHDRARALLEAAGVAADRRFVVMAPGAAYGRAKQWLPERFAELAALLARERGVATVLVGARADAPTCALITNLAARAAIRERRESRGPDPDREGRDSVVVDLSGRTQLDTLASVLARAQAVVANDSGAMHLAAASGTRVVAIFGATDERRTAPLRAGEADPTPAVVSTPVWCRPCMLRECPIDHRCMTGVTAHGVFDALALD